MQNNSGLMPRVAENEDTRRILFLIEAIRGIFNNNLDKGWFLNLLDKMSFPSSSLREIRQMIQLEALYERDTYLLESGVAALEEFIAFAQRSLQPILRDELGVSGFSQDDTTAADQSSVIVKGFFIYAFPYNLNRLADFTNRLKPLVLKLSKDSPPLYSPPSYIDRASRW